MLLLDFSEFIGSKGMILLFNVRDTEDHIAWLLQHGYHEKALAAVEAGQGRSELIDEVLCFWFTWVLTANKSVHAVGFGSIES